MENEEITKHYMKVEIPRETEMTSPTSGLTRQPSTKTNCLCSPTTHVGSFRCRLHRAPTLQRTKSIESASASASLRVPTSKADSSSHVEAL